MARTELAITASRSEQTADRKKAGKGLILVDQKLGLQLGSGSGSGSRSSSSSSSSSGSGSGSGSGSCSGSGNDNFIALAPGQCPIAAISQRLAGDPCDSLHLIAHGAPGQVALGSGLNRQVLLEHAEAIQQWGVKRIVLWSCNTAQDHSFIALLQQLSNAEVIASAGPLGQGETLSATGEPALEQAIAELAYSLAVIESIGNTTLSLLDGYYYLNGDYYLNGSNKIVDRGDIALFPGRYPGFLGAGGGWGALAAETINGINQVLLAPVGGSTQTVFLWHVDASGKELPSGSHAVDRTTNYVEYYGLEVSFGLDLDGNGILGPNRPPVATAGGYEGQENQAINLNLATFASDSDNDGLAFSVASGPANGTINLNSAGTGTYAPTGFDYLPAGALGTDSFVYSVTDGRSDAVTNSVNLAITGVNDIATITANSLPAGSIASSASDISVLETAITGGAAAADAFSIADVDYGEQEFDEATQTVAITADGKGAYQGAGAANRVVGSFSLDSSAATNSVAPGATTGTTADLTITDNGVLNGAANGFASLAAGETATASISLSSEDGTATTLSTVTITGVNDDATITAHGLESDSLAQNASEIRFTETAITGGLAVADAFSIADVDYGEQEFQAASVSQTVEIFADGQGAYQGPTAAGRFVGTFALDASAAHNSVAAGATTGTSADLTITDNGSQNGAENGFASLATGETATASISLSSEDGTATTLSTVTITGVNDGATITSSPYKTNYAQADFNSTPVITHAGAYQVVDIDYGEQEFSSGNYNTSITVDSASGRTGQAVGDFSIVSDGSNRTGGTIHRDAGSQNGDSADVVISSDSASQAGQVFTLAAVRDSDPYNNYGVQLNNTIDGGKGSNGIYDLSDFSLSEAGHGQIEVYRFYNNGDGSITGGGWSATDRHALSETDPLRLIGGINSLAYGETASATLAGPQSEDGTSSTAATTITIAGKNDAPIIDTGKQLKSFELYGTFTVAEMLGFVDPSKTLITDVDYGSMPESIAVSKLTPTGNFADADTGTLQRYNEATEEWEDIDTTTVSESNKLLLRPNDLLRFNANAEAYVSAALGGGSNSGGGIFNVEFRAWDSAYAAALESNDATLDPSDISLFSSGLQTINLALATSGERANATDLTYIPGQAIGIDGSNITVAGELTILTPVKGSVAGAGSSVNDNAVALVDGTSFGGIHGVGSANNITAAGNTVINAQAEGLVSVDASNYFDSFDDAVDADATARLGIKSGPVGSGLVANGAYGLRDVDLEVGANLDLTGIVLGQTLATSRSTDGRAHAGSQFASSAGIANTTADVAGDMALTAEGGILTTVEAFSRNGSAISDSTAAAAYGVVSGLKGSDTIFQVGGALEAKVGLNITMNTKATMVGDGVDNNNGFSFDDEVIADSKIGKSFGLGTLESSLQDLAIDVKDTLALGITNTALLDSLATAVSGDVTAKGQMAGNTGIYRADLQAGGAGSIDVSVKSRVNSLAETTTGDGLASAYSLDSVGIESSDFAFQDPNSSLSVDVDNGSNARALTKHGSATSHLWSSSAGMLGDAATDFVRSVASVNALVNDHGFSQAAGISGTGAVATADQSAMGVSGYAFSTTDAMAMDVSTNVDSRSHAAIVQWG